MTDDPSTATHTPTEPPLGIQQPLLSPVPLGQSMLQPKFLTPLGTNSLRVLDPSIFFPPSVMALPSEKVPFQDSSFFDAPDSTLPESILSESTTPAVQTKPQTSSQKATSEVNLPTAAPLKAVAETPTIETSTVEDFMIAEPLAAIPLANPDTPIAAPPIAEALPSDPSEAALIAQVPQSEPLNISESPSPSILRLSTNTSEKRSIEPLPSNVPAPDSTLFETATHQQEAPTSKRSPEFFPESNAITPIPTSQPTYPAAIQRTTNLEDSASTIAPISDALTSKENTNSATTDSTSSDADLPKPIRPESTSIDNILFLAPASNQTTTASSPVDKLGEIGESVEAAISQTILDAPEAAIARSTAERLIDPVVDVAESGMQSASNQLPMENQEVEPPSSPVPLSQEREAETEESSFLASLPQEKEAEVISLPSASGFRHGDEDGSNAVSMEELAAPASSEFSLPESSDISVEPSSTIARLSEPEASVDVSSPSEPIRETIQRSPLAAAIPELAMTDREDEPGAELVDHPVDSPISDIEAIQPKTTDPIRQGLGITEISLEQSSSEPDGSAEKTQDLQSLDVENLSQLIPPDNLTQSIQPTTNTQIDPVTQSNIEPNIQPQMEAEADLIVAKTPASAIQTEVVAQTDTQSALDSLSIEWIDSSSAESAAPFIQPPSSDSAPRDVVVRPKVFQTPSIQPISEISQPVQRKVADENIVSEAEATAEDESSVEVDRTSPLPELPSVLQRLSILEPIALIQPLHTVPVPAVKPAPVTSSSVIPEIQAQPFEPIASLPFDTFSVRRKSSVEANDYITRSAIAPALEVPTRNSLPQDSPVPTEWANIAELLQPSVDHQSTQEPEIAFADDNYPDLIPSVHPSSSEAIQTSPAPPVETAAPVEKETPGDRGASAQTPAQPNSSGSPEHLERLAQEVYQLIRQRLALERERGGKPGSGRLL
jgi:hypothetical protein